MGNAVKRIPSDFDDFGGWLKELLQGDFDADGGEAGAEPANVAVSFNWALKMEIKQKN